METWNTHGAQQIFEVGTERNLTWGDKWTERSVTFLTACVQWNWTSVKSMRRVLWNWWNHIKMCQSTFLIHQNHAAMWASEAREKLHSFNTRHHRGHLDDYCGIHEISSKPKQCILSYIICHSHIMMAHTSLSVGSSLKLFSMCSKLLVWMQGAAKCRLCPCLNWFTGHFIGIVITHLCRCKFRSLFQKEKK